MSAIAQSAKLERALRFADLAINAAAIPLPVDPVPLALPPDTAPDDAAAGDAADTMRDTHAAQNAPDLQTPQSFTPDPPVPDDAVLNSLQAAIEAVHDSLHETSAGAPESHAPVSGEPARADIGSAEAFPSSIAQSAVSSAETIPADISARDSAADGHANASPDILRAATQPDSLLPHVLEDGTHALQSIETAVGNVTQAVTSTLDHLLAGVVNDTGAVTIPSLGGSGLDALAGLLHPAALAEPSQAPDPALTSLHELPVFEAIGVPEVVHADQELAHATHAPLHLVGSGLI